MLRVNYPELFVYFPAVLKSSLGIDLSEKTKFC